MKLNGLMIGSENPKILGEFYTKVFGEPGMKEDDWNGFDIGGGTLMIGPHSEVKGKNDSPGRIIIAVESDDLEKEFNRIKELGAEVVAAPYQPDKDNSPETWLATFADPDGNYFQLATPWKK
jgi:predicted enzyme related to lactoylglutathione lyase